MLKRILHALFNIHVWDDGKKYASYLPRAKQYTCEICGEQKHYCPYTIEESARLLAKEMAKTRQFDKITTAMRKRREVQRATRNVRSGNYSSNNIYYFDDSNDKRNDCDRYESDSSSSSSSSSSSGGSDD